MTYWSYYSEIFKSGQEMNELWNNSQMFRHNSKVKQVISNTDSVWLKVVSNILHTGLLLYY